MCGITGFWDIGENTHYHEHWIKQMVKSLDHRGPDSSGYYIARGSGPALGHTRLAILDVSSSGAQPMRSHGKRYTIVYNGEIYNYKRLKAGIQWQSDRELRGTSDTEVLLELIETQGLESAVEQINGMFAFAVYDHQSDCLHLVRDRMGIKPLYYGVINNTFFFCSELKSLLEHPLFSARVSPSALAYYFMLGYVPEPFSIYKGINKLPPGTRLTIQRSQITSGILSKPQRYWNLSDHITQEVTSAESSFYEEQLNQHILNAVERRTISDVPLGAFLSGGIDSSTVVAFLAKSKGARIRTFTIGFQESKYDESSYAQAVAKHLQTKHTEIKVTPEEAMKVVPSLSRIFDEPFGDASSIPTFLVSQLARKSVTVCLSGDGGDELFGGYSRYQGALRYYNTLRKVPLPARYMMRLPLRFMLPLLPGNAGMRLKAIKAMRILPNASLFDVYYQVLTHWVPSEIMGKLSKQVLESKMLSEGTAFQNISAFDMQTYLPDDILVKLDRTSMAVALEARVPLLDHNLVEFVSGIPPQYRYGKVGSKSLLKKVLYQEIPRELFRRPKQGFSVPIGQWIRGEMRPWAESLLSEQKLKEDPFIDHKLVRQRWDQHVKGSRNWEHLLWVVLMYQQWRERYKKHLSD